MRQPAFEHKPATQQRFVGHSTVAVAECIVTGRATGPFNSQIREGRLRGSLLMFFAYKNMLGRTEKRTRDRIYCQTMRTVRDISRDDRARIATCSLRTLADRQSDLRQIIV